MKCYIGRIFEQSLQPDLPFVTLFAVAALGKKCANPYGPELQVKQMFEGRRYRGAVVNHEE